MSDNNNYSNIKLNETAKTLIKIQISKTWLKIHIATTTCLRSMVWTNSSSDQDQKDKQFDIIRKVVLQEMNMCNIEAVIVIISYVQC